MLINLRNALMGGRRSPLPPGARWVEYLESTGTQYIDTGILPVVGYTYEMTITPLSGMDGCIFGASRGSTFLQIAQGFSAHWVLYHSAASSAIDLSFVAGQTYNIVFGPSAITINGSAASGLFGTGDISANTIVLFARKYGGAVSMLAPKYRMHAFKIRNGDTVVADFRPIAIGTTGYMLDMVSGQYLPYGNAGTGDFVLGQDVVPVEWIQTDGSAYIDTGLEMADGHEVRAEHYFKRSTTRQLMGSNASRQYYGVSADGYVEFGLLGTNKSTVSVDESKKYLISYAASGGNNTGSIYEGNTLLWSSSGAYYGFSKSFKIFRLSTNASLSFVTGNKIASFKHIASGETIQSLLSVRVGTGSTWEGAMMDVLTRRIYRNAGTGAFGYGNDLKYPIPA